MPIASEEATRGATTATKRRGGITFARLLPAIETRREGFSKASRGLMSRTPALLAEKIDVSFFLLGSLGLLILLDHSVNDLQLVSRYTQRFQSTLREVSEARVDETLGNGKRHVEIVGVVGREVRRERRRSDGVLVT